MDKEIKREARKQYLHYFRVWFLITGIAAVVCAVAFVLQLVRSAKAVRGNDQASAERVYDYADVLTDEEEQRLRTHIAECEQEYHIDLVLVTINQDVESQGYWDTVMRDMADDFYDQNNYGYNKVHGDGALLLENWYEDENGSQQGNWLSTCGIVESRFSMQDIDRVLNEVNRKVETDPCEAYLAYVDTTCRLVKANAVTMRIPWLFVVVAPVLVAVIFVVVHLKQTPAKDTVAANAYVAGGNPKVKVKQDEFLRKNVVARRIETSSGGGGGSSSGGGGHHVSSGGVSHGGGGSRR